MRKTNVKLTGQIEASREFEQFAAAIQVAQPATATFTPKALMLIYLTLGRECLKN